MAAMIQGTGALHPHVATDKAAAGPTLSAIDACDGLGLHVAAFLPTFRDKLALLSVNRAWRRLLSAQQYDASLFETHLKQDFVEGTVLARVAELRELSRRRTYLAFRRRWRLPGKGGQRNCDVGVPWQRPAKDNDADWTNHDDVKSLIFVGRVGEETNPDHCALMEWKEHTDEAGKKRWTLDVSFIGDEDLEEDEGFNAEYGGFDVPHNVEASELLTVEDRDEDWHGDFCWALNDTHHVTLHAIDIRCFRAVTLMERAPSHRCDAEDFPTYFVTTRGHGYGLPQLYAQREPVFDFDEEIPPPKEIESYPIYLPEQLSVRGSLGVYVDTWDGYHGGAAFYTEGGGLEFSFDERSHSTIHEPWAVSSFFRALMKEKCDV